MGNTVTICFANNKGGSGKSTSCSNVGAALAGMGKKVLMVDGDMQLNLSLSFFSEEEVLEMAAGEKNLYYAIGHQSDLSDFIVHTKYENLDLVPSSTLMSSVEYELFTKSLSCGNVCRRLKIPECTITFSLMHRLLLAAG